MLKNLKNKESDILQLPNRRKIYYIVLKNAGCHFREIERRCNLPAGIVKYHLDYLSRHDLIKQDKIESHIRYFPNDIFGEEKRLLSSLRSINARKIILFLLANEEAKHKEILGYVNLAPSTISWHLKNLIKLGVVKSVEIGNRRIFMLNIEKEIIMKLLIAYKKSFFDVLVDRTVEMWGV